MNCRPIIRDEQKMKPEALTGESIRRKVGIDKGSDRSVQCRVNGAGGGGVYHIHGAKQRKTQQRRCCAQASANTKPVKGSSFARHVPCDTRRTTRQRVLRTQGIAPCRNRGVTTGGAGIARKRCFCAYCWPRSPAAVLSQQNVRTCKAKQISPGKFGSRGRGKYANRA